MKQEEEIKRNAASNYVNITATLFDLISRIQTPLLVRFLRAVLNTY
jgi:hypothetical protein